MADEPDIDGLTENEWRLLYKLMLDRIKQAEADGIGPDDPSSAFRAQLIEKIGKRVIEATVAQREH